MHRINCGFLVRPMEPLYFGRPSSFSAGEARFGKSEFPPSPLAFQGLVRSHLLRCVENPALDLDDWSQCARKERETLVGGPNRLPEGWRITGPFPACSEPGKDDFGLDISLLCPWVPTPLYLLKHEPRPVRARPVPAGNPGLNDLSAQGGSEVPLLSGRPDLDEGKPLGGWIGPENLRFALEGEDNGEWRNDRHAKEFPPFVAEEDQPGVAIDPETGSSMQGMLYALKSLRFEHNAGFAGWFDGMADDRIPGGALAGGTVGAGRKNRAAVLEETADTHPAWRHIFEGKHLPREPEENRLFWLAATGPVAVADPLRPEIAAQPPQGVRIVVRGMAAGKPRVMGGFQMATGRTRPNRLYLPGGSAWLVQIAGGSPNDRYRLLDQLHNSNVLGPRDEATFGFGHVFVGLGPTL